VNPPARSVSIERVGPEQWERVKALRLSSLRQDPQSFFKLLSEEIDLTEAAWRARLESATTWVAVLEGADVGLVTSSPDWDDPDAAHLSGLWVDRSARRCGAAQALSQAVIDRARSAGFALVVLWVASANADADRLYAGLGFTRTGRT
jgi:ribosomal protein S18 acetylase RimI-like enzyme